MQTPTRKQFEKSIEVSPEGADKPFGGNLTAHGAESNFPTGGMPYGSMQFGSSEHVGVLRRLVLRRLDLELRSSSQGRPHRKGPGYARTTGRERLSRWSDGACRKSDELHGLLPDKAIAIPCLGWRENALDVQGEAGMGEWVKLTASDGQDVTAYLAAPASQAKGGLVVLQEIFGVNSHIRSVADSYASEGYMVIAPALFDRFEPGVELSYQGEDMKKAFELYAKLNPQTALLDVAAAFHRVEGFGTGAAVLGFCYGGLLAWLSATRGPGFGFRPECTIGYYAGGIGQVATEHPSCPVMLHFGGEDSHIGPEQVEAVRQAHPQLPIHVYEGARHAFNRDVDPGSFNPDAAQLARQRTLSFLRENLA